MKIKERYEKFMYYSFSRKYILSTIIIAAIYLTINILITQFYVLAPFVLGYNLYYIIPALVMNVIIALLVGANLNLFYSRLKELKEINAVGKEGGATLFGTFIGLLGGVCPGCVTGLFPVLFSFFGINTSLSVLPFQGLEIQVFSIVILIIGAYYMSGPNVCKPKIKLKDRGNHK